MLFLELPKTQTLSHNISRHDLFFELEGEKDTSKTFCRMKNFEEHNAVVCFDASYLCKMMR